MPMIYISDKLEGKLLSLTLLRKDKNDKDKRNFDVAIMRVIESLNTLYDVMITYGLKETPDKLIKMKLLEIDGVVRIL